MGVKGGKRSVYAAKKLFFFTFSGSVLLLGSILTMVVLHESVFGEPSALMSDLVKIQLPFIKNTIFSTQTVLFLGFMTAFAVKLPVFPLHTWLPDAHVEAPTGGSIFLASLMLKLGGYGFLRFISLYFPQASAQYAPIVCTLALIGIVYGAVLSFAQSDIKKLVAYSSISHMGYVILGVFTWNHLGLKGASFQMISHGLSTGALFMMIGMLYERVKTKEMKEMGGLSKFMPNFTVCFLILAFANMAVPATSGFVGEFFVLAGAFKSNLFYGLTASLGVFLGAAYTLKMIKQVFYGEVRGTYVPENLYDLKPREWCVLVPIIILILALGIYPSLITGFFTFKSEIVFKFYDGGLYGLI
jgi:NADH-quinone oxidoreductase subunit M